MNKKNKLKRFLTTASLLAISTGIANNVKAAAPATVTVTSTASTDDVGSRFDAVTQANPSPKIIFGSKFVRGNNGSTVFGSTLSDLERRKGELDFQSNGFHISEYDFNGFTGNIHIRGISSYNGLGPILLGNIVDSSNKSQTSTTRFLAAEYHDVNDVILVGGNATSEVAPADYSFLYNMRLASSDYSSVSNLTIDTSMSLDPLDSSKTRTPTPIYFNGRTNSTSQDSTSFLFNKHSNLTVNTDFIVNDPTGANFHTINIATSVDGVDAKLVMYLSNSYISKSNHVISLMHNDRIRDHWTRNSSDPVGNDVERSSINFSSENSEMYFSLLDGTATSHILRLRHGNHLGGDIDGFGIVTIEGVERSASNFVQIGHLDSSDAGSSIGKDRDHRIKALNLTGNSSINLNRPLYAKDLNVAMTAPDKMVVLQGSTVSIGNESKTMYVERINLGREGDAVQVLNDNPARVDISDPILVSGEYQWIDKKISPVDVYIGRDMNVSDKIDFQGTNHALAFYFMNNTVKQGSVRITGDAYADASDPSKIAGTFRFSNESVWDGLAHNIELIEVFGSRQASFEKSGSYTIGNIKFMDVNSTLMVPDGFELAKTTDGKGGVISNDAEAGHLLLGGSAKFQGEIAADYGLKSIQATGSGLVEFPEYFETVALEIRNDDVKVDILNNFNVIKSKDGRIRFYNDGKVYFAGTGSDNTLHSSVQTHYDNMGTLTLGKDVILAEKIGNNGAALKQINIGTATGATIEAKSAVNVHNLNFTNASTDFSMNGSGNYIFGDVTNSSSGDNILNISGQAKFFGQITVGKELGELNINPGADVTFANNAEIKTINVDAEFRVEKNLKVSDAVMLKNDSSIKLANGSSVDGVIKTNADGTGEVWIERSYNIDNKIGEISKALKVVTLYNPGVVNLNTDDLYTNEVNFRNRNSKFIFNTEFVDSPITFTAKENNFGTLVFNYPVSFTNDIGVTGNALNRADINTSGTVAFGNNVDIKNIYINNEDSILEFNMALGSNPVRAVNANIYFTEDAKMIIDGTDIFGNIMSSKESIGTLEVALNSEINGYIGSNGSWINPLKKVNINSEAFVLQDIYADNILINDSLVVDGNIYGNIENEGTLTMNIDREINGNITSPLSKGTLVLFGGNTAKGTIGEVGSVLNKLEIRGFGENIFWKDVYVKNIELFDASDEELTFKGKLFADTINTGNTKSGIISFEDSAIITGPVVAANAASYLKVANVNGNASSAVEFHGATFVDDIYINGPGTVSLSNSKLTDDITNGITFNDAGGNGRVLVEGEFAREVPQLNIIRGARGTLEIDDSVGANAVTVKKNIGDVATSKMLKHLLNNNPDAAGEVVITGVSNAIEKITSVGGVLHMNSGGTAQELLVNEVNLLNDNTSFAVSNNLTLKNISKFGRVSYGNSTNSFNELRLDGSSSLILEDGVNFYALQSSVDGSVSANLVLAGNNIFSAPTIGTPFDKLDVTGINRAARIVGDHQFLGAVTVAKNATLELDGKLTAPTIDGPGMLKTLNSGSIIIDSPVGTLAPANLDIAGGDITFTKQFIASDNINFTGGFGDATVAFADATSKLDANYSNLSNGNDVTYALPAATHTFTNQLGTPEGGDNQINFQLDTGVIVDLSGAVTLHSVNFDTATKNAGELIIGATTPVVMNSIGSSSPLARVVFDANGTIKDAVYADKVEINSAEVRVGNNITSAVVELSASASKLIMEDGFVLDAEISAAAGEVIAEGNVVINKDIVGAADRISFSDYENSTTDINIAKIEAKLVEFNRSHIALSQSLEIAGALTMNNANIALGDKNLSVNDGILTFDGENRISFDITKLTTSYTNAVHDSYGKLVNYNPLEYYEVKIDDLENGYIRANNGVDYKANTQLILNVDDSSVLYPNHEITFEPDSRIPVVVNDGAEINPLDVSNVTINHSHNSTVVLIPEYEKGSLYLTVKNYTPPPPEGAKGKKGEDGDPGKPGAAGAPGPEGNPGPAGPTGPQGDPGEVGEDGDPGENGAPGAPGAQGEVGPAGDPGGIGPEGHPGPVGDPGPAGPIGDPGNKGNTGIPGIQGIAGIQGPQGDPGPAGINGGGGSLAAGGAGGIQSSLGIPQIEAEELVKDQSSILENHIEGLIGVDGAIGVVDSGSYVQGVSAGGKDEDKYGVWISSFYNYTLQQNDNDQAGYVSNRFGGNLGVDIKANENMTVGIAATFANTKIKHDDSRAGDRTEMNSYMLSLYGVHSLTDRWFADTVAIIGVHQINLTDTRVALSSGTEVVKTNYDTMSITGEALFGYKMRNEYGSFSPIVGLRYIRVNESSYKLNGSYDIFIKTKPSNILEAIAGVRVVFGPMQLADARVTPELHVFVEHDIIGKAPTISIDITSQGQGVDVQRAKSIRTEGAVGFDINVERGMLSFGAGYDFKFSKRRFGHQGSLTLRVNF